MSSETKEKPQQKQDQWKKFFKNARYQFQYQWGQIDHPLRDQQPVSDAVFFSKHYIILSDNFQSSSSTFNKSTPFSIKLVKKIGKILVKIENYISFIQKPIDLAIKAVSQIQQQGDCTLTILTLDPHTGTMRSYHVGNSVYAVVNHDQRKANKIQQLYHYDQLPQVPYLIKKRTNKNEFFSLEDRFGDLKNGIYQQLAFFELQNSLIVLGSDGLWENIDLTTIQVILQESKQINQQRQHQQLLFVKESLKSIVKKIKQLFKKSIDTNGNLTQTGILKEQGKQVKLDTSTVIILKVLDKKAKQKNKSIIHKLKQSSSLFKMFFH